MRYWSLWDKIPEEFKPDPEGWAHIAIAALIAILVSCLIVLSLLPARAPATEIDRLDNADDTLAGQIDTLQSTMGTFTGDVANVNDALADYALDVVNLKWRVTATENAIDDLNGWEFSDYELTIQGSGNFTADICLVLDPMVAVNATTYNEAVAFFYSGVNFTTANHDYIPVIVFDGTNWLITQAWFSTGIIEVDAVKTVDITVIGLSGTVNYAYANIYQL